MAPDFPQSWANFRAVGSAVGSPQEGDLLQACRSGRHSEREPLTRTLIKRTGEAEQLALSQAADGKAERNSHFGNNLAVSQKVKHTVTV